MKIEKPYTVEEAARLLRLSPTMVRRHLSNGDIKGNKIGRKWLIPFDEIERICIANYNKGRSWNRWKQERCLQQGKYPFAVSCEMSHTEFEIYRKPYEEWKEKVGLKYIN